MGSLKLENDAKIGVSVVSKFLNPSSTQNRRWAALNNIVYMIMYETFAGKWFLSLVHEDFKLQPYYVLSDIFVMYFLIC